MSLSLNSVQTVHNIRMLSGCREIPTCPFKTSNDAQSEALCQSSEKRNRFKLFSIE